MPATRIDPLDADPRLRQLDDALHDVDEVVEHAALSAHHEGRGYVDRPENRERPRCCPDRPAQRLARRLTWMPPEERTITRASNAAASRWPRRQLKSAATSEFFAFVRWLDGLARCRSAMRVNWPSSRLVTHRAPAEAAAGRCIWRAANADGRNPVPSASPCDRLRDGAASCAAGAQGSTSVMCRTNPAGGIGRSLQHARVSRPSRLC